MKRTAVINVVGLSDSCLGPATPLLNRFISEQAKAAIRPAFPAVTCTAQSNYVTGRTPADHGIVGNGWYNRELAEVQFWKQSNHLVRGPKIWDELRKTDPSFTCAKLFWWYNMYSTADYSITPRPIYPADGRKVFDVYTFPSSIRSEIKDDLGEFPFPAFWGPAASTKGKFAPDAVSRWIAECGKWIERKYQPALSLIYLPHLDYNLQRLGPDHPNIAEDYARMDRIVGDLISFFKESDVQPLILSEYGISSVSQPVHLNRLFRGKGWIAVREELGLELLDAGASKVFAVAEHQVAHIYVNDQSLLRDVQTLLENTAGISALARIDHERAGEVVAVAESNAWFTYYYWLDDRKAPDFARTVDIHRKPGYDPVELFINPDLHFPMAKVAGKLLKKKLGFRMLMDVIPLDSSLVRGSHGRIPKDRRDFPLLIGPPNLLRHQELDSTAVYQVIRSAVLSK